MKEPDKSKVCNILMAEDNEDDFYFFNTALSSLPGSFSLLRTSNGIMFSSLIQSYIEADIVFLEMNTPYKNGIACLKELKSVQQYNSIKVIMYSRSYKALDIDTCYNLGANFYLTKACCNSSRIKQLRDLFENEYFIRNVQPPREHFFINTPTFKSA